MPKKGKKVSAFANNQFDFILCIKLSYKVTHINLKQKRKNYPSNDDCFFMVRDEGLDRLLCILRPRLPSRLKP